MSDTLAALLATCPSAAPALGGAGRPWLSHGGLRAQIRRTRRHLAESGVGSGDRVALVLPNGPEMAAAFLAVAGSATAAPLNPAYRPAELDFYLGDLDARALIVPEGHDGPALDAAARHGLRVLRLGTAAEAPAGTFDLAAERSAAMVRPRAARAEDIALILHTSGTTSRPKMVPLLQRNLAASARHIQAALELGPDDRCLSVMPLFHIHGLIGVVAASLVAGGSVWCAPGFDALRFFGWLERPLRAGTAPSRRCTRRSSPARRATARRSAGAGCASCGLRRRRCRRR